MSTLTPNLNLFKYDVTNDSQTAFSITNALNNNWDIIDDSFGNIMSVSSSMAKSGYLKFDNGFLMNYGTVATMSGEVTWEQPIISQNGTMGGTTFATSAYSVRYASNAAYKAFDGDDSTYCYLTYGNSNWLQWYNPEPIKVTKIYFYGNREMKSVNLLAGNDGVNWDTLPLDVVNITTGNVNVTNSSFYKYYRFCFSNPGSISVQLYTVNITATYISTANNSIIFPMSHASTNYAYSLAYLNGLFGNSYATNKFANGMTLQNNSNADAVYYMTMGY